MTTRVATNSCDKETRYNAANDAEHDHMLFRQTNCATSTSTKLAATCATIGQSLQTTRDNRVNRKLDKVLSVSSPYNICAFGVRHRPYP